MDEEETKGKYILLRGSVAAVDKGIFAYLRDIARAAVSAVSSVRTNSQSQPDTDLPETTREEDLEPAREDFAAWYQARNTFGTEFVPRGELFEAILGAKRHSDRIALVGIRRKSLCLECSTADVTRLSDEDVNLLLAISASELRYQTFKQGLQFGRQLLPGDSVFVSVKGVNLRGVVRFKGELPSCLGTMFGVELPVSSLFDASVLSLRTVHKI